MAMNLLSARKVETIPSQKEPYWLKDGGSLFLYVTPSGSKLWRYRYRYRLGGKPAIYAIGKYPQVSLEAARTERDRARELVKKGVHPVVEKRVNISTQLEKNENTFEPVARRWMASNVQWSEGYADQVKRTLENDVFPKVGKLPVSSIRTAHLRPVIKDVAERGAPTVAILIRQLCSQIFAYAAGEELCDSDPTALLKRSVKRPRVRHHPPLPWQEIPKFLSRVDDAGYRVTVIALRLMALTYVRTLKWVRLIGH